MTRLLAALGALVLSAVAAGAAPTGPPYRVDLTGRTLEEVAVTLHRDFQIKTAIARPAPTRGKKTVQADTLWEMVDAILEEYGVDGFLFGDLLAIGEKPALQAPSTTPDPGEAGRTVRLLLVELWERVKPEALPDGIECVVIPAPLGEREIAAVRDYYRAEVARGEIPARSSPKLASEEKSLLRVVDGMLVVETESVHPKPARRPLGPVPPEAAGEPSAWQNLLSHPGSGQPFAKTRLAATINLDGRGTLGQLVAQIARAVVADIAVDPTLAELPVAVTAPGVSAAEALDLLAVATGAQWGPPHDRLRYTMEPLPSRGLRARERWAMLKGSRMGSPSWASHVWPHLTPEQRAALQRGEKVGIPSIGKSARRWIDFTVAVYAGGGLSSAHSAMKRAETGSMHATFAAYPDGLVLGRVHSSVSGSTTSLCWPMTGKKLERTGTPDDFGPAIGGGAERFGAYDNSYFTDRYSLFHSHAVRSRGYGGRVLRGSWGPPPPWSEKEGEIKR